MYFGSEEVFTIILGALLLVMVIMATKYARRKHNGFTAFAIASYCYALIYIAIPIYYLFNMDSAPLKIANTTLHRDLQYKTMVIAVAGYLTLICGYFIGNRIRIRKHVNIDRHLPLKKYEFWGFLTFLLGMFGVFIEIYLQGGIMNTLSKIDSLRAFTDSSVKDGVNNPLVFFRMFKPFMIFSFYVYNLLSRTTNLLRHKLMSFSTCLLSAYIIFINGGRTHIFIFLATVFVGFLVSSKRKKKVQTASSRKKFFLVLIIISIGVLSLVVLDPLFAYMTYGVPLDFSSTQKIDNLALQFSFPYSNMTFVLSNDFSLRYFQDFFLWIISLLPSFLLSKIGVYKSAPLYEYNTTLQNFSMTSGGIPDDILTLGYYQLGFIGIIVTMLIFGVILSRADKLFISLKANVMLVPIITRTTIYMGMIVMYADLEGTFRGRYDVILLLFLLGDYSRYKITVYSPEIYKKKESFKRTTPTLTLPNHLKEKLMIPVNDTQK